MSEWITNVLSVVAAFLSAIATWLAWKTSVAALDVAKQAELSAAEDRIALARERYSLSVSRLQAQASLLSAATNDAQLLIRSNAMKNDSLGSSRTTLQLDEVDGFAKVAEQALLMLAAAKVNPDEELSLSNLNDAIRNVQLLLVPVDSALERMSYLRARVERV
ncbi:MAG: hypothetical protein LBI66_09885 [Burkholderiaceae bacterium]|jgi:hypothetical protein|nr:hypothetical protein [Burkholderiaceae bacterium]